MRRNAERPTHRTHRSRAGARVLVPAGPDVNHGGCLRRAWSYSFRKSTTFSPARLTLTVLTLPSNSRTFAPLACIGLRWPANRVSQAGDSVSPSVTNCRSNHSPSLSNPRSDHRTVDRPFPVTISCFGCLTTPSCERPTTAASLTTDALNMISSGESHSSRVTASFPLLIILNCTNPGLRPSHRLPRLRSPACSQTAAPMG